MSRRDDEFFFLAKEVTISAARILLSFGQYVASGAEKVSYRWFGSNKKNYNVPFVSLVFLESPFGGATRAGRRVRWVTF